MEKVFVYGSLLKGLGNHRLLEESTLIGTTRSPQGFNMVDLGAFPGVLVDEKITEGTVIGEVYEVDETTMRRLDGLEGYNRDYPERGMYDKKLITTEFGEAFIYTYNSHFSGSTKFVENGDWKTHYFNKFRR